MFKLLLQALGYEVLTADNGAAGIDLLQTEKPPIVLTDIKMPGMDGLSILSKIKTLAPQTRVIVATGHGDIALEKDAYAMGATAFLHKPIEKEALEAALELAQK